MRKNLEGRLFDRLKLLFVIAADMKFKIRAAGKEDCKDISRMIMVRVTSTLNDTLSEMVLWATLLCKCSIVTLVLNVMSP